MAKINDNKNEPINTTPINSELEEKIPSDKRNEEIDLQTLLKKYKELEEMVRKTGDINKINEFDKGQKKLNNFAFSFKEFVDEDDLDKKYPIVSWRMKKNTVREDVRLGLVADQIVEITYLKGGKLQTKDITLQEFTSDLKRTPRLIAKAIKNTDGKDVYITKQINPETKMEYYLMKPTTDIIEVTFDYNGTDLKILSTYLNA